jgi:DsbC/DsbD-like thiol-disulfide interchange protein
MLCGSPNSLNLPHFRNYGSLQAVYISGHRVDEPADQRTSGAKMSGVFQRFLVTLGVALSVLGAFSLALPAPASAGDAPLASDWVDGHKSRTRLSAGATQMDSAPGQLYAFVEINLAEGWKTYWRSPGDSGIPPRFEFAKSKNLGSATVLYPAPKRIDDKGEIIIGYTGTVIFPVALKPVDPAQPIELAADVQFGMCKDICVPTEAALTLTVPADAPVSISSLAKANLDSVPMGPREFDVAQTSKPIWGPYVTKVSTGVGGAAPRKLIIVADFQNGLAGADVFLEAPDGLYLPLLTKTAESGTAVTFEADLSKDVDLAALAGKTITVTLVSAAGSSEGKFKFE